MSSGHGKCLAAGCIPWHAVVVTLVVLLFIAPANLQNSPVDGESTGLRRNLLQASHPVDGVAGYAQQSLSDHLPLFKTLELDLIGPSSFPKPISAAEKAWPDDEISIIWSPISGQHRKDKDAVFLFSGEYRIDTYLLFLTTLRETGYEGDVVFGITKSDWEEQSIRKYLQSDPYAVVYVMDATCYNAEMKAVQSMKGGIRVCHTRNLYGRRQGEGETTPLEDPREARTVQTTRYELYWIWSLNYDKNSWIMLIDARDSVFQSDPFQLVPRSDNPDQQDGVLVFFGENMDATRIGQSKKNKKWLLHAYGPVVGELLADKPTICSGSTMGEQVAIETYLRAMVMESEETGVKLMGADQGFHNYLYYSNKLGNTRTIRSIIVQDQGNAIVNNLGAMRTKELEEWGNGKVVEKTLAKDGKVSDIRVLNWDGSLSPVVHQFDRHPLLSSYWYKRKTNQYYNMWQKEQAKSAEK